MFWRKNTRKTIYFCSSVLDQMGAQISWCCIKKSVLAVRKRTHISIH